MVVIEQVPSTEVRQHLAPQQFLTRVAGVLRNLDEIAFAHGLQLETEWDNGEKVRSATFLVDARLFSIEHYCKEPAGFALLMPTRQVDHRQIAEQVLARLGINPSEFGFIDQGYTDL